LTELSAVLKTLGVSRGSVVYAHTSFSRLKHFQLDAPEFIEILLEAIGDNGTLAMPSFAWNLDPTQRPWKGYADYFEQRPQFDVRTTPTNIGHVPETLRTWPGVARSASYWWSIAAYGQLAHHLTSAQDSVVHPFGPESSFDLLREAGVIILGLGVTLNTTSLAPLVDFALGRDHPHRVFTDAPASGTVITADGRKNETRSFTLLPAAVRVIKPANVFAQSTHLRLAMRRADESNAIQFAYPYAAYHAEALELGRAAAASGRGVPWFPEL
jgi:aminoglycoside 3-N-acetyltransferase